MGQRPIESHGCMKRKICVGYQEEGIDPPPPPPSGEKPANYGQTWTPVVKGRKSVWVYGAHDGHQKSATHIKAHVF